MRDTTPTCPGCGWVGKTTTAALARKSLGKHSCELHRRRQEMAARVVARRADTGERRDCQHTQSRHEHGTRNAYVIDRCRCRPCRDAAREYENRRQRQRAYGREAYVDAAPARAHVRALQERGLGWKRIAGLAGIHNSVMWKLLYGAPTRNMGPSKRVTPETAARILAVPLSSDLTAGGAKVDGVGTRRRLQALVAIGWSISSLGRQIGITNIHNTVHGKNGGDVLASTARVTRELYDRLWAMPPPEQTHRQKISASRARRYAAEFQWPPPMAWDDESIDDPFVGPELGDVDGGLDEMAVLRRGWMADAQAKCAQRNAANRALAAVRELAEPIAAGTQGFDACESVCGHLDCFAVRVIAAASPRSSAPAEAPTNPERGTE